MLSVPECAYQGYEDERQADHAAIDHPIAEARTAAVVTVVIDHDLSPGPLRIGLCPVAQVRIAAARNLLRALRLRLQHGFLAVLDAPCVDGPDDEAYGAVDGGSAKDGREKQHQERHHDPQREDYEKSHVMHSSSS